MDQLESNRKKYKRNIILSFLGCYLFILVGFYTFNIAQHTILFILVAFGAFIPAVYYSYKFKKEYKQIFSEYISKTYPDIEYNPFLKISKEILKTSDIVPLGNRQYSEDAFTYFQNDIKVISYDLKTEKHNKKSTYTLFKGQYIIIEFPRIFDGSHHIEGLNRIQIFDSNYEKIYMEDVEFCNLFKSYTNLPSEFFYIFTPQMIELIKQIRKTYNSDISICVFENQIHLAIDSRIDGFEIKLFDKISEEDFLKGLEIITTIQTIVETLSIDREKYTNTYLT